MSTRKTIVLILLLTLVLVGGAVWWYMTQSSSARSEFAKEFSTFSNKSPAEFCEYHDTQLRNATALKNPNAYIAASSNRHILEKWKHKFIAQEQISDALFEQDVRIIYAYTTERNAGNVLRVQYALLRGWYAISLVAEVNDDGNYSMGVNDSPGYRIRAALADLSCEDVLRKISPDDANADVSIGATTDNLLVYSKGDSCKIIGDYTTTVLSLFSGEIIYSVSKKAPGCAIPL